MSEPPSIPLPNVSEGTTRPVNPNCDLYDGSEETAWVCKGWITKTNTCIRRDDVDCDGFGNTTPR